MSLFPYQQTKPSIFLPPDDTTMQTFCSLQKLYHIPDKKQTPFIKPRWQISIISPRDVHFSPHLQSIHTNLFVSSSIHKHTCLSIVIHRDSCNFLVLIFRDVQFESLSWWGQGIHGWLGFEEVLTWRDGGRHSPEGLTCPEDALTKCVM